MSAALDTGTAPAATPDDYEALIERALATAVAHGADVFTEEHVARGMLANWRRGCRSPERNRSAILHCLSLIYKKASVAVFDAADRLQLLDDRSNWPSPAAADASGDVA